MKTTLDEDDIEIVNLNDWQENPYPGRASPKRPGAIIIWPDQPQEVLERIKKILLKVDFS